MTRFYSTSNLLLDDHVPAVPEASLARTRNHSEGEQRGVAGEVKGIPGALCVEPDARIVLSPIFDKGER